MAIKYTSLKAIFADLPASVIAEATRKTLWPIEQAAVRRWQTRGIPHEHWPVLEKLGVPLEDIRAIDLRIRRAKEAKRKSARPSVAASAA